MSLLQDVEDARSHWDKFRRRELYAIARIEGINHPKGCPATTVVTLLRDSNVNPAKYTPQSAQLSSPRQERIFVDKKHLEAKEVKEEVIEEAKEQIETLDVDTLKMHELRTWCKNHGIKVMPTDKKVNLIEKAKAVINGENAA